MELWIENICFCGSFFLFFFLLLLHVETLGKMQTPIFIERKQLFTIADCKNSNDSDIGLHI